MSFSPSEACVFLRQRVCSCSSACRSLPSWPGEENYHRATAIFFASFSCKSLLPYFGFQSPPDFFFPGGQSIRPATYLVP